VAQQAATVGVLSGGRFTLGVGAGEKLNEHVVGAGWPPADVRHEMLEEGIEIIRLLWQGGYHSYRGQYYAVEDAQVFDLPEHPVPIAVAAGGRRSVELAGRFGDGLVSNAPRGDLVDGFRRHGGAGKPTWCQIAVCWGNDQQAALDVAHERFRFAALGWTVMAELPNPRHFDAATTAVTPQTLAEQIPAGPDPDRYVQAVRQFTDAGFERVAFCQIGDDQLGFLRFWQQELQPRLAEEPVPA
jgi:G6PDH family F420-dependent oxidoreductase